MRGTARCSILMCLVLMLGFAPALAEPTFPALTGRVVDEANLLDSAQEQALTADLKALEDKSSDQVVVGHDPIPARLCHRGLWLSARPPLGDWHEAAQ